ncbi:MAG: cobaltochelatase subunit CobN [Nitrospirota bacterium]
MLYTTAAAEPAPLKVSLLLGDTHSKAAAEVVNAITREHPELKRVSFHVYPSTNIRNSDLTHLRQSSLIILLARGRQLLDAVSPELKEAVQRGAKIYSVGETYGNDFKKAGIVPSKKLNGYFSAGGVENLKNMILCVLGTDFSFPFSCDEVKRFPEVGIYDQRTKNTFSTFQDYQKARPDYGETRPVVGIVLYKSSLDSGQTKHIDALIESLEKVGFTTLSVYGYPSETAVERFFLDEQGKSRVRLVVALGMKIGVNANTSVPLLTKLNVPVLNAITLFSQSKEEWEQSASGLDIFERAWQIALPELAGVIEPTVIASKEKIKDSQTGLEFVEERSIPERVQRLTDRIQAWINLQDKPNKDKRIALLLYTYPPGKHNIGASYLNVLPESIFLMLNRMKEESYFIGDKPLNKEILFDHVFRYGRNIGNWAGGEIDRLARTDKPVLIPLDEYKQWFQELPERLRTAILKDWGPAEKSSIMIWKREDSKKYIVIPVVRYGNILLTSQPARGWEQDSKKLYHDVSIAPHHQYVAFYLWLKKGFQADAIVHIGTHGTHEWLSGKEAGLAPADPPEALIQDIPNIYPYIVDDVGEGLQAKRRGMAVIIDHMTPPFDKAGLNKELRELQGLMNEHASAKGKSTALAESKRVEINNLAKKIGLLKDLSLAEIKTEHDIEALDDYIRDISEKQTPFGLHTFGKTPEKKFIRSTAEAIVSLDKNLSPGEKELRIRQMEKKISESAKRELDSFISALAGRYIPAGPGNDPLRNPDSLPTGKNFYSFDPARIPSKATYEMGMKLANDLIEGYKKRHGTYPDKLTFNLWGVETVRHEGVMDSQIMYLLGIKPVWDERGKVIGVEAISRAELGRARIDVTIVPSGLYRDLFSNLIALLDKAVTLAKDQDEKDNALKAHILKTKEMLMQKGIAEELAERLATVRLFTVPPGAYGTNLEKVIPLSNTWEKEEQLSDIYFMRMSHLYGQGFWGGKETQGSEDLSRTLLQTALRGSKMVVHSRSGNVYATLDNDDFFQYLGGTALAIRAVDGKTPEVYVSNLANPRAPKQETLEKYMGRELRSRYLNPAWIKVMMHEGYAGARYVNKIFENLWGWQVTVPHAVDGAKWNELYETYVLDRNNLGIKEMFEQAKNMHAYQALVARMLETIRKGYWKPDEKIRETLAKEYAETAEEVGLACCDHTCNNPLLTEFTSTILVSVPGLQNLEKNFIKSLDQIKKPVQKEYSYKAQTHAGQSSKQAPGGKSKSVEGYEMQETSAAGASSAPIPYLFIIGFLAFIGLIMLGFKKDRP